jgi:hypothetical protein
MGGISPALCARLVWQVLFYKKLAEPKSQRTLENDALVASSIPMDGNDCTASTDWTAAEHAKLDGHLEGFT